MADMKPLDFSPIESIPHLTVIQECFSVSEPDQAQPEPLDFMPLAEIVAGGEDHD